MVYFCFYSIVYQQMQKYQMWYAIKRPHTPAYLELFFEIYLQNCWRNEFSNISMLCAACRHKILNQRHDTRFNKTPSQCLSVVQMSAEFNQ